MNNPYKKEILAASSGWLALALNFLPGLGAGYIYQRRWVPYFITGGIAAVWFCAGVISSSNTTDHTSSEQLIGFAGLFLISVTTMVGAKIAQNKVL